MILRQGRPRDPVQVFSASAYSAGSPICLCCCAGSSGVCGMPAADGSCSHFLYHFVSCRNNPGTPLPICEEIQDGCWTINLPPLSNGSVEDLAFQVEYAECQHVTKGAVHDGDFSVLMACKNMVPGKVHGTRARRCQAAGQSICRFVPS